MKLKSSSPAPARSTIILVGFALVFATSRLTWASSADFVTHEWGTFTSFQSGAGELLAWCPLDTSRLPGFVYNWGHPGFTRQLAGGPALNKGAMIALQRMETPVIYFYSAKRQAIDVSVDFPQGTITEWYPEVEQIGPAIALAAPWASKLDAYAQKAGANPSFSVTSWLSNPSLKTSSIHWTDVEILPPQPDAARVNSLPFDHSGSHYFAARETDANLLKVYSIMATNRLPEHEKFLFYRGVGNFQTPLKITMTLNGVLTVMNNGQEPIANLLVLSVSDGSGSVVPVEALGPGENRACDLTVRKEPFERVSSKVAHSMAQALQSAGLYQREAEAMVKTWADSWFREDGVRVLYLLPRAWTDHTLPLKLEPQPRELIRVMVGRAEILSPDLQQKLASALSKVQSGDRAATTELVSDFKKLGRFAPPALALVSRDAAPTAAQTAYALLQKTTSSSESTRPAPVLTSTGRTSQP